MVNYLSDCSVLVKGMTYKDSHDVVDPLTSRSTVFCHVHIYVLQNLPFLNCSYNSNEFFTRICSYFIR